jgi:citrate synthase
MSGQPPGPAWVTKVSQIGEDFSSLYGYGVDDLARGMSFTQATFLAMTGRLPREAETTMLDRFLVLGIAHGVAPSGAIVRSLIACGSPIQGALAAGALTMADVHGGAGEETARLLQEEGLALVAELGPRDAAAELMARLKASGRKAPGFGHPFHKAGDPRGKFLLDSATELGLAGPACALVSALEDALAERLGRRIAVNVDGAGAAVITDMGIDWRFARPLMILARLPVNSAHAVEEMSNPTKGWRDLVVVGETYDGPPARPVPRD